MLNIDMSQTYYQTLTNWLDCSYGGGTAAATPVLYNMNNGWGGPNLDCSNYSVVNDGGTMALRMQIPGGTSVASGANPVSLDLNTFNATRTAGYLFPTTYYLEYTFRVATNFSQLCNVSGGCGNPTAPFAIYNYVITNPGAAAHWEFDFTEVFPPQNQTYSNGNLSLHYANATPCGQCYAPAVFNAIGSNFPGGYQHNITNAVEVYHKYGHRVAADGSTSYTGGGGGQNMLWCFYIDGTQQFCSAGGYGNNGGTTDAFWIRNDLQIELTVDQGVTLPSGQPLYAYLVKLAMFGCPNWNVTSPTGGGLTQYGNSCYNTTADTTGRLTGPP